MARRSTTAPVLTTARTKSGRSILLTSSSSDEEESADATPNEEEDSSSIIDSSNDSPIDSSVKETMAKSYKLSTILFGLLSAWILFMPDVTLGKKIASKVGGAAGFGLASGVSNILAGANDRDHLQSDTYKRLNLGILGFSVLGLAAFPGEAAYFYTAPPAIFTSLVMTVVKVFGAVVSYKGWTLGIAKGQTAKEELVQSIKDNFKGLKVQKKKYAGAYRNLLLLVFVGLFSTVNEWIFMMRVSDTIMRIISAEMMYLFGQFDFLKPISPQKLELNGALSAKLVRSTRMTF
jgi:hypothetical protein